MVVILKKCLKMCLNLNRLNKAIENNKTPSGEEISSTLDRTEYFTVMDVSSGVKQIQ